MIGILLNYGLVFGSGLFIGAIITKGWYKEILNKINEVNETEINHARIPDRELGTNKLVLVVRNDLKMGKGKVAAQCSHAAVMAHESSRKARPQIFSDWKNAGQPKIVVKIDSEEEMMDLALKAKSNKILASIVQDAGRTQVASGTKTVLAIGPGPVHMIDQLTGHLKLY